jgi:hypothetical protein
MKDAKNNAKKWGWAKKWDNNLELLTEAKIA